MFRKIGWELTFTYIFLVVFSMAILGFFLLNFIEGYFAENLKQQIYQQAQLVAEGWPEEGSFGKNFVDEIHFYWDMVDRISHQTGSRIRILNHRGAPIYDTGGDRELDLSIRPEVQKALSGIPAEGETKTQFAQAYPIFQYLPQRKKPEVVGVVYVTRDKTYLHAILSYVRGQFYAGFLISLLLSVFLSLMISHYITRPIVDMAKKAELMAEGDLSQRTRVKMNNELGLLSEKFNDMAEKLQGTLNQLTEESNKLSAIIENMAGGVLVVDKNFEIVMINKTATELLGIRDKNVIHKKINSVMAGKSILDLIEESELEKETEGVLDDLPDGKVVDVHISPLLSKGNEIIGAVVILNDITEFKRLDRMRAEFVSNVSHELKTPLACIKGMAELLIDGAIYEDKAIEFLHSINREVDRLTRLVRDLLDLSKMESGMVKIDVHPVDMEETIKQVVVKLSTQAKKKGVFIETQMENIPPVLANVDRVQQVIMNLLDNAIRYTPPNNKITVKLKQLKGFCLVQVEDTGPGIPPEDLERVFERFYRADRSRSREGGGFGLGLAITKQIVENLGGIIGVKSDPPHGTTFYFTLPLCKVKPL